jgi:putative cell wall-binding protein
MKKERKKKWSQEVTEHSNALELEEGVFTWKDPKKIAQSIKKSALNSTHRKSTPYHSAMSMLNFYINRSGKNLPDEQRKILEKAKQKLAELFEKEKFKDMRGSTKHLL